MGTHTPLDLGRVTGLCRGPTADATHAIARSNVAVDMRQAALATSEGGPTLLGVGVRVMLSSCQRLMSGPYSIGSAPMPLIIP